MKWCCANLAPGSNNSHSVIICFHTSFPHNCLYIYIYVKVGLLIYFSTDFVFVIKSILFQLAVDAVFVNAIIYT